MMSLKLSVWNWICPQVDKSGKVNSLNIVVGNAQCFSNYEFTMNCIALLTLFLCLIYLQYSCYFSIYKFLMRLMYFLLCISFEQTGNLTY